MFPTRWIASKLDVTPVAYPSLIRCPHFFEVNVGMTQTHDIQSRKVRRLSRSGPIVTIRARRDFLRVQSKGQKKVMPGFVLHIFERGVSKPPHINAPRAGFTASKKVGGAVQRNLAKRRMRALVRDIIGPKARAHHDYVVVARAQILTRSYRLLEKELKNGLMRLYAQLDSHKV